RRRGGEFVALGFAVERDLDGDMPASVAMYMLVPLDFENFDGEADIDWRMNVSAVFDLIRLDQRLLALAHENQDFIGALVDNSASDKRLPERFVRSGEHWPGLRTLAVDKKL